MTGETQAVAVADRPPELDLPVIRTEPCQFWFVWTKRGRVPRYAHSSYTDACNEAMRLARKHPGRKFIVLEGVAKFSIGGPDGQ